MHKDDSFYTSQAVGERVLSELGLDTKHVTEFCIEFKCDRPPVITVQRLLTAGDVKRVTEVLKLFKEDPEE